jgi:predicted permease
MRFAADIRSALKSLLATRSATAAAIFTLALGTGAFTAVFALADGVLLKPLPYAAPDRLAVITNERAVDANELAIPAAEMPEWRQRLTSYTTISAYARGEFTVRDGAGDPEVVRAAVVTGDFFDLLGARPERGVPFRADDPRVIVVSSRYAARLAATGGTVGRVASVGQVPFEIVAVMPASFAMPDDDVDLWIPLRAVPGVPGLGPGDRRSYRLVGRLRDGVTLEQAADEARVVLASMPGGGGGRRASVRLLEDLVIGTARPVVWALAASGALLLLVACANVATLLVGRALARQREFAVRLSIGASRSGLVRASLFESAILAAIGSALGLWLAHYGLRAFAVVAADVMPRLETVALDLRAATASVAVTMFVALVCGLAPAVTAGRSDLAILLRRTPGVGGRGNRRLRATLVGAQLALVVLLLVGTGLLARTVWTLLRTETGATTRNAVTTRLALTETTTFDAASRAQFVDELLRRVRELPGVTAAGLGSSLPPRTNQIEMTFRVVNEGRDESFGVNLVAATPGFLAGARRPARRRPRSRRPRRAAGAAGRRRGQRAVRAAAVAGPRADRSRAADADADRGRAARTAACRRRRRQRPLHRSRVADARQHLHAVVAALHRIAVSRRPHGRRSGAPDPGPATSHPRARSESAVAARADARRGDDAGRRVAHGATRGRRRHRRGGSGDGILWTADVAGPWRRRTPARARDPARDRRNVRRRGAADGVRRPEDRRHRGGRGAGARGGRRPRARVGRLRHQPV